MIDESAQLHATNLITIDYGACEIDETVFGHDQFEEGAGLLGILRGNRGGTLMLQIFILFLYFLSYSLVAPFFAGFAAGYDCPVWVGQP